MGEGQDGEATMLVVVAMEAMARATMAQVEATPEVGYLLVEPTSPAAKNGRTSVVNGSSEKQEACEQLKRCVGSEVLSLPLLRRAAMDTYEATKVVLSWRCDAAPFFP
jgi:hypothetical protein